MDMFRGTIPSALAATTPHRRGSAAQGTWMVDERYWVHLGKEMRVEGSPTSGKNRLSRMQRSRPFK